MHIALVQGSCNTLWHKVFHVRYGFGNSMPPGGYGFCKRISHAIRACAGGVHNLRGSIQVMLAQLQPYV